MPDNRTPALDLVVQFGSRKMLLNFFFLKKTQIITCTMAFGYLR